VEEEKPETYEETPEAPAGAEQAAETEQSAEAEQPAETAKKPEAPADLSKMPAEVRNNLNNIVEALLFAAEEPLSASRIREMTAIPLDTRNLRKVVGEINRKLQAERRPFEIAEAAGGFQYRTIAVYQKWIKMLFKDRAMRRLSQQALETLAIVAYRQPASKGEIEEIRGVSTDGAMKTLLERRLIKILGKSEDKPGKPIVYGTTRDFLKYFGLNRISDLPKVEEIEDIARAQEPGDERTDLVLGLKREAEFEKTLKEPEPLPEAPSDEAPSEAAPSEAAPAGEAGDTAAPAADVSPAEPKPSDPPQ
jgi:segregation and condensation protein B